MRILISGASGLIGSSAAFALDTAGNTINRLVRDARRAGKGDVVTDASGEAVKANDLEPFDVILHLAGESIADGRWTEAKKERIRTSRVELTRSIAEGLAKLPPRPRVLLCASAIGYYGNRGDEVLDESSASGNDFLSEVCREWEAATQPAASAARVVNLRFGVVLSGQGGALKKMLLPFKLNLGGKIGSGQQWMSWVALDDVVGAILHALANESVRGPVNVVSPNPVTNLEFTKKMGRELGRLTILPMPEVVARTAFGEMAEALLLTSQRVKPERLSSAGYTFKYPTVGVAIRHVLGLA